MSENINVMYIFGDIRNPVDDASLKYIQSGVYKLTDINKKIAILKKEFKEISDKIDSSINNARKYGYTDKDIAETIGTLYIA